MRCRKWEEASLEHAPSRIWQAAVLGSLPPHEAEGGRRKAQLGREGKSGTVSLLSNDFFPSLSILADAI